MPRTARETFVIRAFAAGLVTAVLLAASPPVLSAVQPTPPAASQPVPQAPAEFAAWYHQQVQEINPKDTDRLYKLALACWTNKHQDQAAEVCRRILASWPDHARAKALLRLSTQHLAASRPATSQPAGSRPAGSRPASSQPVAAVPNVLTAEAINRLRFAEFCYKDMNDRPHVVILPAVIREFLAEMDKTQAMTEQEKVQFHGSGNDDKLRWIVLHTGLRYADRIQVNTEPRNLTDYRQKVWPIISKSCGSATCHGGEQAGRLRFILPTTLPVIGATNFYILNTFEGDDGRLVNRDHPEASLLLQYGLPADQAELRHPAPSQPLFTTGTSDSKYRVVLEWIRSLRTPTPDYQVSEKMWQPLAVKPSAATQPARRLAGH